jgi:hypothetical protein
MCGGRLLTFIIGESTYCIEMYFIREIVGLQVITELPDTPNYINRRADSSDSGNSGANKQERPEFWSGQYTSTASEELSAQAEQLKENVSIFRSLGSSNSVDRASPINLSYNNLEKQRELNT